MGGWIGIIVVGGIAGWIAEKLMKADHSIFVNIGLGVAGAIVLNAILMAVIGTTFGGFIGQLIVAVVGACGLIYGYRLIKSRS